MNEPKSFGNWLGVVRFVPVLLLSLAGCGQGPGPAGSQTTPTAAASQRTVGVPLAPTGVLAVGGNGQITLTWKSSAGATRYFIYRSSAPGGPYTVVATVTRSPFLDTGIPSGTTYYYLVQAANTFGTSGNSLQASATTNAPPAAPTGLTAVDEIGQVSLSWTASVGATGYSLVRIAVAGGATVVFPVFRTSFVDGTAVVGVAYNYYVVAWNDAGPSGPSNTVLGVALSGKIMMTVNGRWSNHQVLVFDQANAGNVPPFRTFDQNPGPYHPWGLATDAVHNEVYITSGRWWGNGAVYVYDKEATPSDPPLRTIAGGNTGFSNPRGIAVDTVHDEIYVVDSWLNSIKTFSRTANGNVSPLRTISGGNTTLNRAHGLAEDPVHNEIFIANNWNSEVLVFSRTANGNVSWIRRIRGGNTGISQPRGIAYDPVNDEIYVGNGWYPSTINVFPRTANGNVTPTRSFTQNPINFERPHGIVVDPIRNEVYVSFWCCTDGGAIEVFPRLANGSTTPIRTISGGNTTFSYGPMGIGLFDTP